MLHHIQSRGFLLEEAEKSVNHEGHEGSRRKADTFCSSFVDLGVLRGYCLCSVAVPRLV